MAQTAFRGPAYSAGSLLDSRIDSEDGPGLEYQANAFPDVRWTPTNKDGKAPGRIPAFLNSPFTVLVDNIPTAASVAGLAAAQALTAATPMTLVTVAPGSSTAGVPSTARVQLVPFQQGAAAAVAVSAIDFGFTTGNTTAGSATIASIPDSSVFTPGQWICVGGAGNAAKTASLFTQVRTIASTTSITVFPAALGTLTGAPIGSTNLPAGAYAEPNISPSGVDPYLTAGLCRLFNPPEGIARCISVTGNAASSAQSMAITGYDIFGNIMHETIAFAGGATTKFGQKAFKYLLSAVPSATDAGHLVSIGWGDTFGINLRSDKWEFMNEFFAGSFATSSSGWLAALANTAAPSTATTADVRGTVQIGANGNGATPAAPLATSPNGTTNRIMFAMTVPVLADIQATPINPAPLFGVAQF